jgi:hypothetical protein
MNKAIVIAMALILPFLAGCEKSPTNRLLNPDGDGRASGWTGSWMLFDDELHTDGNNVEGWLFTWGSNFNVDFNCTDNPYKGKKCIKMDWNGGVLSYFYEGTIKAVTNFAGFSFTTRDNLPIDLTGAHYRHLTFYARKEYMGSNVELRVEDPLGNKDSANSIDYWQGTLTDTWQKYTIDIADTLSHVEKFAAFSLKIANSDISCVGAIVYIDNIELTQ